MRPPTAHSPTAQTSAPATGQPDDPHTDAAVDAPSADAVYQAFAQRLLDNQIAAGNLLDNKAAGIIGIGSSILPLTFVLLSLPERSPPGITIWLLFVALLAYVVLLWSASRAFRIRAVEFCPNVTTLERFREVRDGAMLRRWAAEEYAASVQVNQPKLHAKAVWVGRANLSLFTEGILICVAAGASLFS